MVAAVSVDSDPRDACSADIDAPLRLTRPLTIGGFGSDVFVGGPPGPAITVGADDRGVWMQRHITQAGARAILGDGREPLPHGAQFDHDGVTFTVHGDVGAPLDHVHAVGAWLVFDAVRVDRPGRRWAFTRRWQGTHACLVRRVPYDAPRDESALERWQEDGAGADTCAALRRARGVNLMTFLGRAGADLDPVMGAHLAKRLATVGYLVDVDVGWDGSVFPRPPRVPAGRPDEVTRLNTLLRFLLPARAQAVLHTQGVAVDDVLRSALEYDTFDALILGREVESALRALELRPMPDTEVANAVRGLFPDEWRAEQELLEQLAMLDDDAMRALLERARA